DWIHVSDSCNAISKIIDKAPDNEIYNISAKQEFMNLEVAQIICNTIGYGHELITHVDDRPGHDFRYSMNNDKIKGLDWSPQYKFRDGIQQTCQWFITNKYVLRM
ncbi:MAG: GDP-mannose 4,6-dehydratase, partial [Clostridia bacterium]